MRPLCRTHKTSLVHDSIFVAADVAVVTTVLRVAAHCPEWSTAAVKVIAVQPLLALVPEETWIIEG